ncbi:MAG: hypothetical protein AB1898_07245 [Acidobacteriota bacterium]
MKIQFDSNQQYQLEAVAAVTKLLTGSPWARPNGINQLNWETPPRPWSLDSC